MCDACLEMELYFAYLNEIEAKKKSEQQKSQTWQCEVSVIPPDNASEPGAVAAADPPAKGKARFVCDEPE